MSLVIKIVAFTTNIIIVIIYYQDCKLNSAYRLLYSIKSRLPRQLQACHGMLKDIVQLL